MFQGAECEISPVTKKTRSNGPTNAEAVPEPVPEAVPVGAAPVRVSSGRGKWNPSRRNFTAKKTQDDGSHKGWTYITRTLGDTWQQTVQHAD